VPHDRTKISRAGARFGPRAIRDATLMFDFAATEMAGGQLVDIDSGLTFKYQKERVRDVGDVTVVGEPSRDMIEIKSTFERIAQARAIPLMLGGDHFVTYPAVAGLNAGRQRRLAYVHIDMHLDLADVVPGFGRLASGTPLRRLIDDGTFAGSHTLIVGVESLQHRNEWEYATEQSVRVISADQLRASPLAISLWPSVEAVLAGAEAMYLSIDIDVLGRAYAPGTGNAVGASGLTPSELLAILRMLRDIPLAGVDLVEVAPNLDPTGRTAGIGVAALIELLWPMLFHETSS
jgi:arginase family enzyme